MSGFNLFKFFIKMFINFVFAKLWKFSENDMYLVSTNVTLLEVIKISLLFRI